MKTETMKSDGEEEVARDEGVETKGQSQARVVSFSLSVVELASLLTVSFLLIRDLVQNGFEVSTEFTKVFDFVDFTIGFRSRQSPGGKYDFNLNTTKNVKLRYLYVFCTNILLKFVGSIFIKFIYFGTLMLPSLSDVGLFIIALSVVQFSSNDIVFEYLSNHPLFSLVFNFGITIFKTRKLLSIITTATTLEYSISSTIWYTIWSMEFVGLTLKHEPTFATNTFSWNIENIESFIISNLISTNIFYDVLVALLVRPIGRDPLSPVVFCLMCARYMNKPMRKFFETDLEDVVLNIKSYKGRIQMKWPKFKVVSSDTLDVPALAIDWANNLRVFGDKLHEGVQALEEVYVAFLDKIGMLKFITPYETMEKLLETKTNVFLTQLGLACYMGLTITYPMLLPLLIIPGTLFHLKPGSPPFPTTNYIFLLLINLTLINTDLCIILTSDSPSPPALFIRPLLQIYLWYIAERGDTSVGGAQFVCSKALIEIERYFAKHNIKIPPLERIIEATAPKMKRK